MAASRARRKAIVAPLEKKLVQAVRSSLNLPELGVRVRRARAPGCWSVCLEQGQAHSEWLELDAGSVAVIKKVGLLPPLQLGVFRLAYAVLQSKKPAARS